MKILLTGGGTGGHFFPLIAVAAAVREKAAQEGLSQVELYFASDDPIDAALLAANNITYVPIMAGKRRTYSAGLQNFLDIFRTIGGVFVALYKMLVLYPDVVFSKGGYAAFPTLLAARILFIPVVIHESDTVPGRVNIWAGKFAQYVALSYPEAAQYFPHKDRIANTGQPIRKEIMNMVPRDVRTELGLESGLPVVLVLGGSQGAEAINDLIVDIIPELLKYCIVVHQTGNSNLEWVTLRAVGALSGNPHGNRYLRYGFIDAPTLQALGSVATLIISRAGSSIFEFAAWGKPSILIPLPIAHGDHQKVNAYAYARSGAAVVLEQSNLKGSIMLSTVQGILNDQVRMERMQNAAREFHHPGAADAIAQSILAIATSHR